MNPPAVVRSSTKLADGVGGAGQLAHETRSQKPGPIGSSKSRWATMYPALSTRDRKLGEGPLGRAEDHLAAVRDVEGRLVARAEEVVGLLLVQRDGAAHVGADLGVGDDPVERPVLAPRHDLEVARVETDEEDDGLRLLLKRVLRLVEPVGDDVEDGADRHVRRLDGRAVGVAS